MATSGFRRRESVQQSMLPTIKEKDFQKQVIHLAQLFGWAHYHATIAQWSQRGWPDLVLCRPPRLVLAELKSPVGKLSPDQKVWIELLEQCPGVETFVWRPADIERIAEILR